MRAPLVAKNGGYGGRGGGGAGGGKNKMDRESERLKSELERFSKELRAKERECKELQMDRVKKDEQLKVDNLHIENKDAEICRLKSTNLTCLPQAKDVQTDGQCAVPEVKNQIRIENGLTNTRGIAVQEKCFPRGTSQSKRRKTMGVQTYIVQVRHEVAPLQILLEALFDLCTLENVVAAHKSLCILRAILQHLSCRTRLDKSVLCSGTMFWLTDLNPTAFLRVDVLVWEFKVQVIHQL